MALPCFSAAVRRIKMLDDTKAALSTGMDGRSCAVTARGGAGPAGRLGDFVVWGYEGG